MGAITPFPATLDRTGNELEWLFENAPMGIAQCDLEGRVITMNRAFAELVYQRAGDSCHVPFYKQLVDEDGKKVEAMFAQLASGRETSFQIEARLTVSSMLSIRWTAWGIWWLRDNRPTSPDGVLVTTENAESLLTAGRVVGSIAHDFNNLLASIRLSSGLIGQCLTAHNLGEKSAEVERLRKYADEIRASSLQAEAVVQQLITLGRPGNHTPQPISLNEIFADMRIVLLRLLGENIELALHFEPRLALVKIDTVQAQQILLNLVLNARDAMPAGGRIEVETANCRLQILPKGARNVRQTASVPCALFAVGDNGRGMDEKTRRRALRAYFTTKKDGRGSGLGLNSVHCIVSSRGGLVHIDSVKDRGTRVTVILPAVAEAAHRLQ